MAKQKRSGSGFFWGLVIGIAIGATLAWVLTPQPGELEGMKAPAGGATDSATAANDAKAGAAPTDASGAGAANGAQPTIVDIAMAAVERVRGRVGEAMAMGREAYEQGQAEVMQRFNQARTME